MIKKTVAALICGIAIFGLVGCGSTDVKDGNDAKPSVEQSKDVDVKVVKEKMLEEGYIRGAKEIEEVDAVETYHLNMDDVSEYAIVETMISPGPGFMMIVEAKDGKVDAVKASVDKVLADKIGLAFYPEEKELTESAKVEVNGNVVSLVILNSEVSENAKTKLSELLK